MFVVLMVMSVHLSHVIAHPFQLHGCSKEVELMKARDVGRSTNRWYCPMGTQKVEL